MEIKYFSLIFVFLLSCTSSIKENNGNKINSKLSNVDYNWCISVIEDFEKNEKVKIKRQYIILDSLEIYFPEHVTEDSINTLNLSLEMKNSLEQKIINLLDKKDIPKFKSRRQSSLYDSKDFFIFELWYFVHSGETIKNPWE